MEFDELYQEVILDHTRRPRNFGELPGASTHVHGDNPMCGDEITVHLKLGDSGLVEDVSFTGSGCSICMASASLMTLKVKNKPAADSVRLTNKFTSLLTDPAAPLDPANLSEQGDLQALLGVRKFPLRVKCATLPWHALKQGLEHPGAPSDLTVDPTPQA